MNRGDTQHETTSWVEIPLASRTRNHWYNFFRSSMEYWNPVQGEASLIITWNRRPLENEELRVVTLAAIRQTDQSESWLSSLGYIIGHKFLSLDCVKDIYFDFDEEQTTISVWIILEAVTEKNRKHVYGKELELIDEFPQIIFNFRSVGAEGSATPISSEYRHISKKSIRA